jgi:hypothetical protein
MGSSSGLPYLQNQHNPFLETEIQYSATQAHIGEWNMWKKNLYLAKKNLFSVIHLPIIASLNIKSLPSHSSLKTLASLSVINCTAQRDNAHVAVMSSFTRWLQQQILRFYLLTDHSSLPSKHVFTLEALL